METLTPDVAEEIADCITSLECPLWDRHDLLRDAAALACVGNSNATLIARAIFSYLSPRLGKPIPDDLSESSTATQLKALCKQWGLPTGGKKADLWQRIVDEVEDDEEYDGEAPTHCLVSAATRRELMAHKQARVSASRAKEAYGLSKSSLSSLSYVEGPLSKGMLAGYPTRLYLLSDVKSKARKAATFYSRDGSWERRGKELAASLQYKTSDAAKQARAKDKKQKAERKDALRAALAAKGIHGFIAERLMHDMLAFEFLYHIGAGGKMTADEAADGLNERLFLLLHTNYHVHMARLKQGFNNRRSTWSQEEQAKTEARRLALNDWVAAWDSLDVMLGSNELPDSLSARVQEIWAQQQAAMHAGTGQQVAAAAAAPADAVAGGNAGAEAAEQAAGGSEVFEGAAAADGAGGGAAVSFARLDEGLRQQAAAGLGSQAVEDRAAGAGAGVGTDAAGAASTSAAGAAGGVMDEPPLKRCRVD